MFFRGKHINPTKLWSEYTEIKDDEAGDFLPLCYCPNPNHPNSHSPAFQVNVKKPLVHCFSGCGISGTYEHAIALIEGIYDKNGVTEQDLENAKKRRRHDEGMEIRKSRAKVSKSRREAKVVIFKKSSVSHGDLRIRVSKSHRTRLKSIDIRDQGVDELTDEKLADYSYLPKEALAYLKSRGISESSRSRWQVGYDEEAQRITIPVRDARDRLQFIIRRAIYKSQRPAYLYPSDSLKSSLLFGGCVLDRELVASEGLIVVEGSIDCLRLHQHGFRNTVALLGSSISRKQLMEITKLRPKRIYLFLDKDAAGVKGIEKATTLLEKKYQIKIPVYPIQEGPLDPASLTKEQVEKSITKAIPVLCLKKRLRKIQPRKISGGVS